MTDNTALLEKLGNFHPQPGAKPKHLGIIPDGSRRWARNHGLSFEEAYLHSLQHLQQWIQIAYAKGYGSVSVYLSSQQNYQRKPEEIEAFSRATATWLSSGLPDLAEECGIQVMLAGIHSMLPTYVRAPLQSLVDATYNNSQFHLYLCMAYNPLWEILQAMGDQSNPDFVSELQVPEPLDLVIRTGDAPLTSNFLPLQTGFAHKVFRSELFADISIDDYKDILTTFENRNRQYGN